MGVRKEKQQMRKEANKSIAFVNNCPTSPRKMRLVTVRGQKVERALNILRFSSKEASRKLENWFYL
jgi:large subunit ribosomal protein L22